MAVRTAKNCPILPVPIPAPTPPVDLPRDPDEISFTNAASDDMEAVTGELDAEEEWSLEFGRMEIEHIEEEAH